VNDHHHCPAHGDDPKAQPFEHEGRLYCSWCSVHRHELVEMVPCTPETCPDEV
jgi:hypothetical protein